MVYLLKMMIFHGYVSHNQMVTTTWYHGLHPPTAALALPGAFASPGPAAEAVAGGLFSAQPFPDRRGARAGAGDGTTGRGDGSVGGAVGCWVAPWKIVIVIDIYIYIYTHYYYYYYYYYYYIFLFYIYISYTYIYICMYVMQCNAM